VTDGARDQLQPFLTEIKPLNYLGEPYSDLLGLLLLSRSDLVICSNSTYSRLACFMNDRPYIWISDTLVRDTSDNYGYLWPRNGTPRTYRLKLAPKKSDEDRDAIRRCFAIGYDATALPDGLRRFLASRGTLPIDLWDDLLYGDGVFVL
jgi:hypothetical protein